MATPDHLRASTLAYKLAYASILTFGLLHMFEYNHDNTSMSSSSSSEEEWEDVESLPLGER